MEGQLALRSQPPMVSQQNLLEVQSVSLAQAANQPTTLRTAAAPPTTAPETQPLEDLSVAAVGSRQSRPHSSPTLAEALEQDPSFSSLAAGGPVRVNSLAFEIEYALQEVGRSGIRQVDGYITEDNGRHWFHYGRDTDSQSPFQISVPREGRYGFSFRVQNGAGVAAHPPQPGETPDVRVEVDVTPPTVRLLGVTPVGGQGSGQVQISWHADDRELAAGPIAMHWAETAAGPWNLIASEITNTGRYVWHVPSNMPPTVLVRLTATDVCNNAVATTTPQPVVVDFSQPSLRVLHVAPKR